MDLVMMKTGQGDRCVGTLIAIAIENYTKCEGTVTWGYVSHGFNPPAPSVSPQWPFFQKPHARPV